MRKEEFLSQLNNALQSMDALERARTVQYYREILEDRMEDGLSEEEAVAEMEPVEVIAADLLSDSGKGTPRPRRHSIWSILVIILGSPVWLPVLLAVGVVLLAVYAVVWALILTMFAVVAALAVCLPAGIFAVFWYWVTSPLGGLFCLGAGMICAAFSILLFFPVLSFTGWLIRLTGQAGRAVWHRIFRRKEADQ